MHGDKIEFLVLILGGNHYYQVVERAGKPRKHQKNFRKNRKNFVTDYRGVPQTWSTTNVVDFSGVLIFRLGATNVVDVFQVLDEVIRFKSSRCNLSVTVGCHLRPYTAVFERGDSANLNHYVSHKKVISLI